MTLKDVELTIGGEKIMVTNLEVSFDGDVFQRGETKICVEGIMCPKWEVGIDVARFGDDRSYFQRHFMGDWEYDKEEETKKEDTSMGRNRCDGETACADEGYYGGESLAQDIKDLELDEDQKLLLDYGLVNRSGLITNKGKEVLLNHLLKANAKEIVASLKKLEEAEKEN